MVIDLRRVWVVDGGCGGWWRMWTWLGWLLIWWTGDVGFLVTVFV